jgi:hypothetical protein
MNHGPVIRCILLPWLFRQSPLQLPEVHLLWVIRSQPQTTQLSTTTSKGARTGVIKSQPGTTELSDPQFWCLQHTWNVCTQEKSLVLLFPLFVSLPPQPPRGHFSLPSQMSDELSSICSDDFIILSISHVNHQLHSSKTNKMPKLCQCCMRKSNPYQI